MEKNDLLNIEEKLFSHSLGSKLGHTLKAMVKMIASRFSKHGLDLTLEQVYVLIILNEENRLIQQDVAEVMGKDKSAVFRQVDSLEKKHLVARMENPDDKRQKLLMLTKKGIKVLKEAKGLQAEVIDEVTDGIEPSKLKVCEDVLQEIYGNAMKS